jgi:hypothetical protein
MGENDSGYRQRPQFVELPDPRRRLIMGSRVSLDRRITRALSIWTPQEMTISNKMRY